MKTNWNFAFRCTALLLFVSSCGLLIACGGGIAGSGNGGGSSNPDIPPGEEKYNIEFLPLQIAPALPASISQDTDKPDWFDNRNPAQTLTYGIANLIDNKVALGMMQLYIDSGWEDILQFCNVQQAATQCSLQNSGLSIAYTNAMALWEIDLRKNIEREKLGLSGTLSAQSINTIEQQAIDNVGSQVQLNSVVFEKFEDQEFDYLVTMEIDELMPLRCVLSWDSSKLVVTTSVSTEPGATTKSLYKASYDHGSGKGKFGLMLTESDSEREIDIQVQLDEIPDTDELYLESTLTQTTGSEKKEIKSRGQINDQEAYIFSESTVTTPTTENKVLHREVVAAGPLASATCDPVASTNNCTLETDWTTVFGADPTTTELYLSNEQLDEYATQPDNISLGGVSGSKNGFLLLDSDQVTPDLQNNVLRISIQGLGVGEWPLEEQQDGTSSYLLPIFQIPVLAELTLCAVERSLTDSQEPLTAACDAPPEDLLNAVIVSNTLTASGELMITLETNAVVTLIE